MSLKIDLPLRRVVSHTSLTLSAGLLSMLLSGSLQANPQLMTEVDARGAQELRYANFEQWLNEFRRFAATQGISEATLATALNGVRYRDRVIELDRYQPEFVRPIWEYLDSAASDTRVNTGRERFEENRQTALEMQQRFGVPAEIVVAIWGIESNYGSNFGDFSTIEALATLAYDGRRRDFARGELLAALRIIEQGDISAERMKGSWAGAMGHTQFIPSSFEAYAVDGDGDGHRDIWGSIPDVMASTANYLARAGWQTGQPWGVEVVLPASFDYSQTERLSSAEWSRQGVRALEGELPDFESAAIVIPAGAQGPAFVVGPNFRAILRYNNATSYALAVATLADKIAGGAGIQQSWPRGEAALTRDDVKELQQRLNDAGYGVGGADGVMGPNTREGLRAFQRQQGLTPDAFATQSLLERLRQAR
ncbi:MAG: lytic murein transglycosylase [Halomonadaceae bacterium]|uniref:Lytic murein transglycosylase n=1 Tax=Halomonas colorata TaxID=2742615 RepID=A0ABR9G1C6_9GAMM|nr:lytic murein transglycosylase [Halomonas colorata]MBE0464709.1 lytic murein transglycosylase [Halomonas colorata]